MLKANKSEKIRKLLAKKVDRQQIVEDLKVSPQLVYAVAVNGGFLKKKAKKAKKQSKIIKAVKETKQALDAVKIKKDPKAEAWHKRNRWSGVNKSKTVDAKLGTPKITRKELLNEINPGLNALFGLEYKKLDLVNHPLHYKVGGIEVIDFIESKDLNYRLGNVVKYFSRAGKKNSDPVQDLEKAAWYLQREIDARKGA
jgi:hypothetical protein